MSNAKEKPKKSFFGALKGLISSSSATPTTQNSPGPGPRKVTLEKKGDEDASKKETISVQKADANAVVLSLGELAKEAEVITGEAVFCSSCHAALSMFSVLEKVFFPQDIEVFFC